MIYSIIVYIEITQESHVIQCGILSQKQLMNGVVKHYWIEGR